MTDFFIVIIFIILFFYLATAVGRLVLRNWLNRKQKEFEQMMGGSGAGGNTRRGGQRSTKPEGEVTVERTVHVEKKVNRGIGDYVEYEEVEIEEERKVD